MKKLMLAAAGGTVLGLVATTQLAGPLVAQDPQLGDLAGHPLDVVGTVVVGGRDQSEQAGPVDRADHPAGNPHFRRRYPLQ